MDIRKVTATLAGMAMSIAAVAGCTSDSGTASQGASSASSPAASPTPTATPTPTPTESVAELSREAKLAVQRCADALMDIGIPLTGYVNGLDELHSEAVGAAEAADSACGEAATQVSVDGFPGAAVMIYDELLKEVAPVSLGLSTGNKKFLKKYAKHFAPFGVGPVFEWGYDLKAEVGMIPPDWREGS